MQRVINRVQPLVLSGLLLALPWAAALPKNVKPDPNGLAPQDVKDLHYGDVLFYFFQDDYFDSITRLLAARQLERIPHTQGEAELLLGGLYLSLGEHVEAGRIFEALLNQNTSEAVRNKAWFYLGKVWYQRDYLDESERALRQVSARNCSGVKRCSAATCGRSKPRCWPRTTRRPWRPISISSGRMSRSGESREISSCR